MVKRITIVIAVFFIVCIVAVGQNYPEIKESRNDHYARFVPFTPIIGKGCGTITDIFQDNLGYIWLAGTQCLSKFDGNAIRKYVNDGTPGSLPSSNVTCITQDHYGRLWVGTKNGLCIYDYNKDVFINIIGPDTSRVEDDSLFIRAILADGDSLLWIDTQQGFLWKIDLEKLIVINTFHHKFSHQPYYYYHDIYRDPKGILWLGGRGVGPFQLDEKTEFLKTLPYDAKKIIPGIKHDGDAAYFYTDSNNNFWIGALDGIYLYNTSTNHFRNFMTASSWTMLESSDGELWFGTAFGLGRYDTATHEMVLYSHNEEDPYSIPSDNIYKIFEDSHQQIWAATSKGVAVLKPGVVGVNYIFHIPGLVHTLASSSVSDLLEDPDGKIWIATLGKGVDCYNPENFSIVHYNSNNVRGLKSDMVKCLALSSDNNIYCGLWAGVGFGKLDHQNEVFDLYTYEPDNTNFDWYNDIVFDDSGILYLGFWGGHGLTIFDTATMQFVRHLKDKFQLVHISRHITCLKYDSNDRLWMGTTSSGLHLYLPDQDTSRCYNIKVNPESGINATKINVIEEDQYENIWVGAKGLFLLETGNESFRSINLSSTDDEPEIFSILPEYDTAIWLLTDRGLLCYDHRNSMITDYTQWIHLNYKDRTAAIIKTKDGSLVVGGEDGLAIVNPRLIDKNTHKPNIYLSSLSVFDEIIIPSFDTNIQVDLNYDENFFSIQIGSDIWGDDDTYNYFYLLNGFNKEWSEISKSDKVAVFTNVPPGSYEFLIKVVDAQGDTLIEKSYCNLQIIPPFYYRWWFILSLIIIIAFVIAFIVRGRIKRIRVSLLNSELNQKLLRLQMNPHFIFNSLFAIQNFIYSKQIHLAGDYLSDFARLIRLILDNSRHEYISIDKEMECIELYLKLQKLRFASKFDYEILIDPELKSGEYMIPPMLAQPFLENAIEHGLKNINYPGELKVSYKLKKDNMEFKVVDNGIGLVASGKINENKEKKHESLAISICRKRLEILRNAGMSKISFAIEEIINEDGSVLGTKVAFNIPYNRN